MSIDLEKLNIKKNYKTLIKLSNQYINESIECKTLQETQNKRLLAIRTLDKIANCLDVTDYLLIDSKPEISEQTYVDVYFNMGTLYKTYIETEIEYQKAELQKNQLNRTSNNLVLTNEQEQNLRKGINCFVNILRVRFEDDLALKQILSIYTQLCFFAQHDISKCLMYMQEALLYIPNDETIHYNLGYIYQKMNKLELSIIHYKISISLTELHTSNKDSKESKDDKRKLSLNNYNGISCIYRSIKQWPQALYYLLKSEKIDPLDPDIQNQLGVVYTEMRRTDLAEIAYNKGIKNYQRTFISTDKQFFLSELYLNLGHMHSYNGDNSKSVDSYNKSLQICPKFNLPFQNKIMNLSYLFDQLEDKMYILNQHKLVNKLYKKGNGLFKFTPEFYQSDKINIGIISGDFVDHPVSFFIGTFLKNFDSSKFNVTCYSECIIDTSLFNQNLKFKTIKNVSSENASAMIHNDKIHILLDLAGHTAFNRLDIFAMKPSPIQITYIGYPYSTGLNEMDYRITDNVCDNDDISQKFYTEKLLYLQNCFLCYDPNVTKINNKGLKNHFDVPKLSEQPFNKNGYITFGCFNRVNKITDSVIDLFNKILIKYTNARFVFKTKALINKSIQKIFLDKFDKNVRSRIRILDCTISHEEHLLTYNQIDLAIDTFPYSGTTTSCEALYMGVPVFSLYDTKYFFHAQNVTCSILQNSNMSEYIFNDYNELYTQIDNLQKNDNDFWENLKTNTREKFLSGKVCDKKEYMKNLNNMFTTLFESYSK
jgi:predicted O-linked N-acetylglucosamine transferase (SPINDLY family)